MKKIFLSVLPILLYVSTSQAYEVADSHLSYVDSKFLNLGVGMGYVDFANEKGIDGGPGFGFRIVIGHHFNEYLEAEFSYQYSRFGLTSPDPVFPKTTVESKANMNQEVLQLVLSYPKWDMQPYIEGGFGAYNIFGVGRSTGLHFDDSMVFPVGAGVRTYLNKDFISLDLNFSYQFLMGENQTADRLTTLGISKVSFETFSAMASVVFHML